MSSSRSLLRGDIFHSKQHRFTCFTNHHDPKHGQPFVHIRSSRKFSAKPLVRARFDHVDPAALPFMFELLDHGVCSFLFPDKIVLEAEWACWLKYEGAVIDILIEAHNAGPFFVDGEVLEDDGEEIGTVSVRPEDLCTLEIELERPLDLPGNGSDEKVRKFLTQLHQLGGIRTASYTRETRKIILVADDLGIDNYDPEWFSKGSALLRIIRRAKNDGRIINSLLNLVS